MKTNYTVPSLSTLEGNGIKDLISVGYCLEELRLIRLTGVPVRIRIDKDYAELTSTEDEIDLSAYKPVFEKLMKFFYGIGYIFGYVNENKLQVYDIYTNDNFFSTRDLAIIERETGLPIANPIIEGNLSFDDLISVLNKKVNDEGIPAEELHILPSVYIDDTREWEEIKPKETSVVILGEKKTYPSYNNTYGTYNNYGTYNSANHTSTGTSTVNPTVEKTKETKVEIKKHDVFLFTSKEERTAIFRETYKNVQSFIAKNATSFTEKDMDWWEKYGKFTTYLYSIHTLPVTRKIVYDYAETYYIDYYDRYLPVTDKWASLFSDFFQEEYSDLKKVSEFIKDYSFDIFFGVFFQEELKEFDKFYVKEVDLKEDWRFNKNLGYLGGA